MKRLLTFLALLGFSAISLVAVARVVRKEASVEGQFDRAAMEAWLTSTDPETHRFDFAAAPPQVRRAARMLERDFHDDYDWRPYFESLDDEAREQFRRNFMALARMLFEQRADRYAVLPSHQREPYLDGQLNDFSNWYLLNDRGRKVQGIEMFSTGARLADDLSEASLRDANDTAARRRADADFLRDLQSHYMKRAIGRFLPGKKEKRKRDD